MSVSHRTEVVSRVVRTAAVRARSAHEQLLYDISHNTPLPPVQKQPRTQSRPNRKGVAALVRPNRKRAIDLLRKEPGAKPRIVRARQLLRSTNLAGRSKIPVCDLTLDIVGGLTCHYPDNSGRFITANGVREILSRHRNARSIHLRVDCIGGGVKEALYIREALIATKAKIYATVEHVGSAGNIILFAASYREAGPHASFFVHDPSSGPYGDREPDRWTAKRLRERADMLEGLSDRVAEIYVAATGQPEATIRRLRSRDTWFNAREAMRYGWVHAIVGKSCSGIGG